MSPKNSQVQHIVIELKAKVDELDTVRTKLIQYEPAQIGVFRQIDTYYNVPQGRLKLREVEGKIDAELIYYERENVAKPKRSTVFILAVPQCKVFKEILERIMKVKNIVDKVREIYLYEGIQIHLDTVEDLGSFIEFECISSHDSAQQKKDILRLENLKEELNISSERLQEFSYSDLI